MVGLEIGIELLSRASCGYYEVPWRRQLRRKEAEYSSKIVETLVQKLRKLTQLQKGLQGWDGCSTKLLGRELDEAVASAHGPGLGTRARLPARAHGLQQS
jgi:hypothetical protein